jgi:ABC-type sugar transport system permease subunit
VPKQSWPVNSSNNVRRTGRTVRRPPDTPLYASRWFELFIIIPIVFILVIAFLPALEGVALSFDHNGPSLANYRAVLGDPLFWRALGNNLLIPGASLMLEMAAGLSFALALGSCRGRWTAAAEIAAIIPFALPEIVLLSAARYIFMPHGYLDGVLLAADLPALPWLIPGRALCLLTVTIVDAWHITPVVMLIIIGGLQAIPAELYEAARMDGAGPITTFRHVTLPMLAPAIVAAVVLRGVDALRIFSTTLVLTGAEGVPVLSTYAYQLWGDEQEPRLAMAASVLLAVLISAIALAGFMWLRRRQVLEAAL